MISLFIHHFFHLVMLPFTLGLVVWLIRYRSIPGLLALLVLYFGVGSVLCVATGASRLIGAFYVLTLGSWLLFAYCPALFLAVAVAWRSKHRPIAIGAAIVAGMFTVVGVDAFVVEPSWCETRTYTIPTGKLEQPLRIALLADVQTEDVGGYERRVLQRVMDAEPDLILFAGDYVQCKTPQRQQAVIRELHDALVGTGIEAPLGVHAVQGNIDGDGWQRIFSGIRSSTVSTSRTSDLGPLVLTTLSWEDSRNGTGRIPRQDKFHVVVGHAPDYALTDPPADLLLAGHVHGGQVQLPWVGPLITFTRVPRAWASGLTELPGGNHLLVSRGIGGERGEAPRLRFLCRPELAIIDLLPR